MDASRSHSKPPSDSHPHEMHERRRKNINDAYIYLMEVKDTFHEQSDKYVAFLNVMTVLHARRIDYSTAIARVKELFMGHNNLIMGFNTFLPPGYKIALDDEEEESVTSTARDY